MRSVLTLATLSVGASALVPHIGPRNDSPDGEWFTLTANGPPTKLGSTHGAIGQLGDGQNRIGDGYPKGEYRIKDGKVWDKHGRGCILTPPTTQWQCDEGAIPTDGFGIDCRGNLFHRDSWTWWVCPVNDNGVWNIYKLPAPGQKKCVALTNLSTHGGPPAAKCPAPLAPPKSLPPLPSCSPTSIPGKPLPPHCYAPQPPSPPPCESVYPPPSPLPGRPGQAPPPPCPVPATSSWLWPAHGPPAGGYWFPPSSSTKTSSTSAKPTSSYSSSSYSKSTSTASTTTSSTSTWSTPTPTPNKCGKENKCGKKQGGWDNDHYPSACPISLDGDYEFPHYIVPVYEEKPDKISKPSFNGTIAPGVHSIFNFDIHPDHAGKTCSLVFLLPEQWELETSAFTYTGHGALSFSVLDKPAGRKTTWNNKGKSTSLAIEPAWPGHNIHVASAPCLAGQKIAIEVGQYGDIALNYFQDSNPAPIGLYVSVC